LFHYAGDRHSITILVRPKLWRSQQPRPTPHAAGGGAHRVFVLHECEDILVRLDADFARFLTETVQGSINDDVRLRAQRKPGNQEAPEETSDAVLNELVAFATARESALDATPSPTASATEAEVDLGAHLQDLMHLAARCQRQGDPWTHSAEGTEGPGGVVSATGQNSREPLGLVSQWLFVNQVEERLRTIRRGYLPMVETLGMIRGRITTRGLVQYSAQRVPQIECEHDEFTEATPLFRVVATALEFISNGTAAARMGLTEWTVAKSLAERALHVRRILAPIPSFPIRVAAHEVTRIRLSRTQRNWSAPLALARQILCAEPPRTAAAKSGGSAVQWWFDTSKLWEQVIEQSLSTGGRGWLAEAQGRTDGERKSLVVWTQVGNGKRPDIVAWRTDPDGRIRRYVMDAKYKQGLGGGVAAVSSEDQYQMFTYSHLAQVHEAGADAAALLYPGTTGRLNRRTTALRGAYPPGAGTPFELHRIELPFPRPMAGQAEARSDIESNESWSAYLERVRQALEVGLGLLSDEADADAASTEIAR
jgi:hypothetical protein